MRQDGSKAGCGRSLRGSGDDHGFTLFELLIALTLVALLVSIIVPGARSLLQRELANTAERMIVDLRRQRLAALRLGDTVMVDIEAYLAGAENLELRARTGGSFVEFMPDGSSSGGSFEISDGRRSIAIIVDPLTGAIGRIGDG